jgi:hypothetical protein
MSRDGNSAAIMGAIYVTGSMGLSMNQYKPKTTKKTNLVAIGEKLKKHLALHLGVSSSLTG